MSHTILLDAKLDHAAAPNLTTLLMGKQDVDLVLDMSNVQFLGATCLQVLLAAAKSAGATEKALLVQSVPDRVVDQMRVMGVTPEAITRRPQ